VRSQNIEVAVKYAQARILAEISDPAFTVEITRFRILFDVPEFQTSGTVATSAGGVVSVVYPTSYNNPPRLALTIRGATSGDDAKISNETNLGFDLKIENPAATLVVRNVHWIASGF
jgi:hypothetical protein